MCHFQVPEPHFEPKILTLGVKASFLGPKASFLLSTHPHLEVPNPCLKVHRLISRAQSITFKARSLILCIKSVICGVQSLIYRFQNCLLRTALYLGDRRLFSGGNLHPFSRHGWWLLASGPVLRAGGAAGGPSVQAPGAAAGAVPGSQTAERRLQREEADETPMRLRCRAGTAVWGIAYL